MHHGLYSVGEVLRGHVQCLKTMGVAKSSSGETQKEVVCMQMLIRWTENVHLFWCSPDRCFQLGAHSPADPPPEIS